jgi:hypothetical protein
MASFKLINTRGQVAMSVVIAGKHDCALPDIAPCSSSS